MQFLSDLWHAVFGKRETPAEWAAKLHDEELMSYWIAGPEWLDRHEFNAVMNEMDRRKLGMPHVPGPRSE